MIWWHRNMLLYCAKHSCDIFWYCEPGPIWSAQTPDGWCLSCSKNLVFKHQLWAVRTVAMDGKIPNARHMKAALVNYHEQLRSMNYCVMLGMLRDLFMMRRTSTSGRLSCFVWAQPSSAAAMCRSKRSDTDFFRSLGFPLKKEPSHCLITLSIFSVLTRNVKRVRNKNDHDSKLFN